ncbi:MAG: DNA replication/repair protein RecF [Acidobacteriota bacterium]
MHITAIEVRDFRNFEVVRYTPDRGLNILIGENAQGKTNFLEAAYFLASGSTFRSGKEKDLIRFGQTSFYLRADYQEEDKSRNIEVLYQADRPKSIKINNKRRFPATEKPVVVLFTPDDLFLLKGAPQGRRAFIDFVLAQVSPEYQTNLSTYERVLRRRNQLLRDDKVQPIMLDTLDKVMAESAAPVILARLNLLKVLEEYAAQYYEQISGGQEKLTMKYALSFPLQGGKLNYEIIREALQSCLQQHRKQEMARRTSLFGPHRDDINLYIDNNPARIFASQGQQRNIVVALKLAEMEAVNKVRGSYPIFLLDEVLAELDSRRREIMLQLLQTAPFQSFLTSVEVSHFDEVSGKIIKVNKGHLLS